ncbi:2-oxoglutarate dehydrogenase subunit E1 [Algimonas ampicilliniresistens]|jgi:2-oxoglutarate dehydrogenase E1 component|uniref:2-oxoglutarate dehydrogenase E1 component n=1 Tax=Algimonas ampicilliniresistens TaxID=1298735 RepID=A0ABQ5V6J4_9PROT|nr:2-oxoglutarate dehydrogenase E1 component [Algimonas ampicilliniresistens]GLQ22622.1 2-oxoglutarate dehydrogenase subunit E1 [Algimonas ampicilliniresistens]
MAKRTELNQAFIDTDFLDGGSAFYLEQMQARYADNPASVDASWRAYFDALGEDRQNARANADGPSWKRDNWPPTPNGDLTNALTGDWGDNAVAAEAKIATKQPDLSADQVRQAAKDSLHALMLIRAYRVRGHLIADLDPLGLRKQGTHPELDPNTYGFGPDDRDREIFIDGVLGLEYATINNILEIVQRTYCSTIGVQFMHISDPEEKAWIQERIEGPDKQVSFTKEGRLAILQKLIEAESFEQLIHKRYPGTKRFGLDGAEALLPALEQIIKRGGQLGLQDINFGMPHRGRLNVMASVMQKPYSAIFYEFLGGVASGAEDFGSGDVKYHLGVSDDREFDGNKVHLSLAPNPSHLEVVAPVVIGKARAKQQSMSGTYRTHNPKRVMAVLLHGDSAFAGQGVVTETFQLSQLAGYRTGGSIHVIVNNQIGFTTTPDEYRSGQYCSDVAFMVQAPVLHVNGDDPEAVVYAARIATEYRQKFGRDVVIDIVCYRRYGHNEGDDPSFTQPIMYKVIGDKPSSREIYAQRLIAQGDLTDAEHTQRVDDFYAFLDKEFDEAKNFETKAPDWLDGVWTGISLPSMDDEKRRGVTGVPIETLKEIGTKITTVPNHVNIHRTLKRIIKMRADKVEAGHDIDWGLAEHLAFGSLVMEGHPVRLSGQDSERGTFSQRQSHFIDQTTEEKYTPLNNLSDDQQYYQVLNSHLSEEAVLGFEYGFSTTAPQALTIWEAQFGDFANGAQVMVDQFISSAEQKWLRMSGLVMLLPHGYEGQGPEHSSARLERYLQMCAEDNMQVCNVSTPSNYFHVLRRQLHRNFRKPLIIMSPKSLLRHKLCVSTFEEMGPDTFFHRVLWDDAEYRPDAFQVKLVDDKKIKRVVICSGKIYFDLLEAREELGRNDIYLLRVEQFYPYPDTALKTELSRFKQADMVWAQEEPKNMGAWSFIEPLLEETLTEIGAENTRPRYVGRKAAASTATGIAAKHKKEQQAIFDGVFAK